MSQQADPLVVSDPTPLATPRTIVSAGVRLSFGEAGPSDAPLILLVHGSRAHCQWWARVVPLLAERYRVAWFDLSGHGDSGHRDLYSADIWANEVVDVAMTLAGDGPVVLAGHSMGGRIAVAAADAAPPGLFSRLVLLETRLWARSESERPMMQARTAPTVFEVKDTAIQKFRLSPPQDLDDEPMRLLLAQSAVRVTEGGWRWKYDYRGIPPLVGDDILDRLERVSIPITAVWGDESAIIGPDYEAVLNGSVRAPLQTAVVAGAAHHIIVDSPQATAATILHAADPYTSSE